MIYGIILGIHVIICVCLVLVVLLQASKGGGLAGGSAFGGGAESTVFGGRGAATFLAKATRVFGAAFMITSLTLTLVGGAPTETRRSIVAEEAQQAPFVPPGQTAAPGTGQGAGTPLEQPGPPVGPQLPPPGSQPGAGGSAPAGGDGDAGSASGGDGAGNGQSQEGP